MAESSKPVEAAIDLMKRALLLLDEADECFAAADLQQAIDTAAKTPIASSADDEAELIALFDTLTRKR